jgi:hypothetical protein
MELTIASSLYGRTILGNPGRVDCRKGISPPEQGELEGVIDLS